MPKLKTDKLDNRSLIKFELKRLEDKVKEFQDYLAINKINNSVVNSDNTFILAEDTQDQLHKEILIQIKMQDAVFNWVPLLEKLREVKGEILETRGDIEINGLFKNKT
jgi:hypothetical protein